jgi:hypothetical protein
MNIKSLILLAFCLCTFSAFAQNTHSIKGIAIDTAAKSKVSATITVLRPDSIMQAFGYAGNDGAFTISGLPAGKYILLTSFPEYADFSSPFTIGATEAVHDFGNISMTLLSKILNEAVVKGSINALKMRGDTSDFNAKAFVIQPNSKVDDLLKQIPGMEIDQNGAIKFRGKAIDKMLVDGEEFFSDDPVLVSRTLRGDMISRVQVYEKRSDQATFTGVDDGQRKQVIDLKLKEDKKVGMFGKLDGAGGRAEDDRTMYAGQLQFNRFRANSKMAVYGTMANTGKVNLSYSDQSNLGTQNSSLLGIDGVGVVSFSIGGGDDPDNATYGGRGYPVAKTGGAHYDVKFGKGESINTNYRIGQIQNTQMDNTITDRLISEQTSTHTTSNSESVNTTFRQKLDLMYQKTSLTSNLRFTIDGALRNNESNSMNNSLQVDQDGNFVNSTRQTNNRSSEAKLFNASMFYSQKFKKARRTLSWNLSENYSQSKEDLFAKTNIDYAAFPDNVVDQYKPTNATSSLLSSNLTYTEPLAAKLTLTFNYLLGLNNSISRQESFNKGTSGNYDQIDEITTNDYKYNVLTNQFGAIFSHVTPKTNATFGARASSVNFNQVDERRLTERNRNFVNWIPQANFRYMPKQGKTFGISYNGNTRQPSLSQIQPVVNNLNPTNLTIGNPDLKQLFQHSVSGNYSTSSTLTGSTFFVSGGYSLTQNAIIPNTNYDPATGISTTQYVNLTDHTPHNFNISTYISKKIVSWDVSISPQLSYSSGTSYTYTREGNVTGLNRSNNSNYSAYLSISKNKTKKYSISLSGNAGYTTTKNSFTTRGDYKAFSGGINSSSTIYLPGRFEMFGRISYSYQGPSSNTDLGAVHRANIDASISRTFLKGNNLKMSVTGTNLLDQTPNNRSPQGNIITQSTYNVIRRYFMLNLIWDFTKFGTLPANK